jgi:hypothetical protein
MRIVLVTSILIESQRNQKFYNHDALLFFLSPTVDAELSSTSTSLTLARERLTTTRRRLAETAHVAAAHKTTEQRGRQASMCDHLTR